MIGVREDVFNLFVIVESSVYTNATYQQGRYDEHGVARHGYEADVPFIDTL